MANIVAISNKAWTAELALHDALESKPDAVVVVVMKKDTDGKDWNTVIGGDLSTGDLLIAAELLRQRAVRDGLT